MDAEVEITVNWVHLGLLSIMGIAGAGAPPQKAKELNDRGLEARQRGDYAAALRDLSEALRMWQSLGSAFEPHAAIEMMNLGDTYCGQGDWSQGTKFFEQALELSRRSMGPKDLHTVSDVNRLANVYLVQGELERGEGLYREVLATERELYPNDVQTAHTLAGLASVHGRQGKSQEALSEAEEGLAITLRAVGESDFEAGLAYANVAQTHRLGGRNDRAIPLLHKAYEILQRTLGPTHPRVLAVLSQEGLVLTYEGKLSLAEQDLVRAVDLLSRSKATNADLSMAEQNLGILRMRQKKYADADRWLTSALSLEEQYLARPGMEMASTLQMLSEVRRKERRFEEAARLEDRAHTIQSYR